MTSHGGTWLGGDDGTVVEAAHEEHMCPPCLWGP